MAAIPWEKGSETKFSKMIERIPIFLRPLAQEKVLKKAESLALALGQKEMREKDLVDAFFAETPFGFHGPMKSDMDELGIDYKKYGHS